MVVPNWVCGRALVKEYFSSASLDLYIPLIHQCELMESLTNLLSYNKVTETVEIETIIYILYLGFSKVFDKVPHQQLLLKLQAHGVD